MVFLLLISIQVLHPRHKLNYFKNAGWCDGWIRTARKIVHDEYDQSYKGRNGNSTRVELSNEETNKEQVRRTILLPLFNSNFFTYRTKELKRRETYLTPYPHLLSRSHQSSSTSLIAISVQTQNMYQTRSLGGASDVRCIQCSLAWRWTICLFQVSTQFLAFNVSFLLVLLSLPQQLQSMSSVYSARAAFYCHMSAIVFQYNQHVP